MLKQTCGTFDIDIILACGVQVIINTDKNNLLSNTPSNILGVSTYSDHGNGQIIGTLKIQCEKTSALKII